MLVDGLALLGAKPSTSSVMTKSGSYIHIFTGQAPKGFACFLRYPGSAVQGLLTNAEVHQEGFIYHQTKALNFSLKVCNKSIAENAKLISGTENNTSRDLQCVYLWD